MRNPNAFLEYILKNVIGNVDEETVRRMIEDFASRISGEITKTLIVWMNHFMEDKIRRVIREELERLKDDYQKK